MSLELNYSADNAGGSGTTVAFSYSVVEEGLKKLMTLGGNLEEFITQLKNFRDVSPDIWNGSDHNLYEGIMADAEKGLAQTNENITSIKNWLSGASESHSGNEARNTSLLGRAYAATER